MYPPIINPALLRYQQIFNQPVGNDLPEQGGFFGMNPMPVAQGPLPQRLGQSEPLGGLPQVIDPSQIGSEMIPETEESYIAKRLSELYQPQTSASTRLNELLNQYPQREKPGFLQKLVASLSGFGGGPQAADKVLYGGYDRQVQDWQNRVKPISELADQERYLNQNQRILANQMIGRELDVRKQTHKEKVDERNIAIREKRAAAYEFKARNPNMQIKQDSEGNFIGINPQTGQMAYVTDSQGNRVNGRELSWEDKQNILQENALERINRSAEVGLGRIQASGEQARETKAAPNYDDLNPDKIVKPQSPSEQRTARTLAAEQLLDEHPDWEEYIQFDGNRVTINPDTPKNIKNQIESALAGNRSRTKTVLEQIRKNRGSQELERETKPQSQSVVAPSGVKTSGSAPPIESRKIGQEHTFPNGNVGRWDGSKWVPVKVVTR